MMLPSILKDIYTEWKAAPSNSLLDSYLIHFISGFSSTLRFTKKKKDSWHFVSFFIHACIPTSSHISSLRYSNPCYDRIEPYTKSPFMATLHWYLFLRQKLNWTCLTLQFAFPLSQQQDWQDWGTDRWNVTSSLNAPLGGKFRVKGEKKKKKNQFSQNVNHIYCTCQIRTVITPFCEKKLASWETCSVLEKNWVVYSLEM